MTTDGAPERAARGWMESDERRVLVCSACLRACCWQGWFVCEDAQGAGLAEKSIAELRGLGREHARYWEEGR